MRWVLSRSQTQEPPLFRAGTPRPPAPKPKVQYPVEDELTSLYSAYGGRVTLFYFSRFTSNEPDTERRTREACLAHGWSCVFLRQSFPRLDGTGEAPYGFANTSFNSGHPNRLGHRLAAELIAAELSRLHERGLF